MNKIAKRILFGIQIWIIPLSLSFMVWDVEANAPKVSAEIFNMLMSVSWVIAFSIAAYFYFRNVKINMPEAVTTGITWFVIQGILDLLVLVMMFGESVENYISILFTYLNTILLCILLAKIFEHKKKTHQKT